jgi:hypothetical protein
MPELGRCDHTGLDLPPLWQDFPHVITLHGTETAIAKGPESVVALMVAALYSVDAETVSRASPYHPEQRLATAELLATIPAVSPKDGTGKRFTTSPVHMVLDIQHMAPDVAVSRNSGFEYFIPLHFDTTAQDDALEAGNMDAFLALPSEGDFEQACSRLEAAVVKLLAEGEWQTASSSSRHGGRHSR